MDKNAIKKYAVWARRELISRVSQKALQYGITEKNMVDAGADSVNGHLLTSVEKKQRQALIAKIKKENYGQVMEEVAYTWFNRFIALRFMEVNGYLPTHVRVFTDANNAFKPQILTEAIHLEVDGLDMDKVYALKTANQTDELFKYLIITQCNALSLILPGMFQKIEDYTELLFPDNLLREGSVIEQMIAMIPEEDWKDEVQIIGWLYQYYNTEPKAAVFGRPSGEKIKKEDIPAATQLFTPDWIVRYMVENSLGRLWIERTLAQPAGFTFPIAFPTTLDDRYDQIRQLKANWKYYIDDAKQEPEVQAQLEKIREEYKALTPEQIKCIDPCMGSGHILVYMFDVLMQIYEAYGFSIRDAVASIVQNNLYGLDIDDRAAQLAYFSVMMKARQYDTRFFSRKLQPHVYAIRESDNINRDQLKYFGAGLSPLERNNALNQISGLLDTLLDAKEYGSILNVKPCDWDLLRRFVAEIGGEGQIELDAMGLDKTRDQLLILIDIGGVMAQKYDVVVTNPPYMGSSGMGAKLSEFVKKNYPDSKSDLFAVFIEKCGELLKPSGYQAMITQHAWMFLSSYEKLRSKLIHRDIVNMAHLGARAFEEIGGEVVQTTAFVMSKHNIADFEATYVRLVDYGSQQAKEEAFLSGTDRHTAKEENFGKIPGCPVAYWVSGAMLRAFKHSLIADVAAPRAGLATGDNTIYQRLWYEVNFTKIGFGYTDVSETKTGLHKWFPCDSGGEFRKWATNNEYVVNWENDGQELRNLRNAAGKLAARPQNTQYYFKRGLTWNKLSSSRFAVKYKEKGSIYDDTSRSAFPNSENELYYLIGLLCSRVSFEYLKALNPTMSFTNADIERLPYVFLESKKKMIDALVSANISLSRTDWDSFETSWDFKRHPLITYSVYPVEREVMEPTITASGGEDYYIDTTLLYTLENTFEMWKQECEKRFDTLKRNEEELNRIFIDIYGLQDELTPEEDDKDVTVHYIADTKEDAPKGMRNSPYLLTKQDVIKSLISYAVGCMFGRYSLDKEGLIFAGGNFDEVYWKFLGQAPCDKDGSLPYGSGYAGISLAKYHYPYFRDSDDISTATKLTYSPDVDNCIPICDDDYFEDDILGRFVKFIEVVYGEETLEENLKFIADALGGKGSPREVIRNYFLNDFYADHCKTYKKRPIYWLFDSGKKNGFKALIYMHRYQPDTLARMRTDYVHEQQARYRTALADVEQRMTGASGSERVKLNKQLAKLQGQATEIREYEEKIHHLADQMISIDLDDGVKHNYAIFKDVLAPIK